MRAAVLRRAGEALQRHTDELRDWLVREPLICHHPSTRSDRPDLLDYLTCGMLTGDKKPSGRPGPDQWRMKTTPRANASPAPRSAQALSECR